MAYLLKLIILTILVIEVISVDLDYINTDTDSTDQTTTTPATTVTASHRRMYDIFRKSLAPVTETTTSKATTLDNKQIEKQYDDDIVFYIPTKKRTVVARRQKPKSTTQVTEAASVKNLETHPSSTRKKLLSKMLKEYDYNVLDSEFDVARDLLRQHEQEGPDLEGKSYESASTIISSPLNESKNKFSELYNLEPAAASFNYQQPELPPTTFDTWFVPEQYPCWDLPLLYGELGKKHKNEEVFLISPIKLKRVIDDNVEMSTLDLTSTIDINTNKWCNRAPCYGDHTLCLYPSEKLNSKICDSSYVVMAPNVYEQIELVNTVNSMRNHVAKGTPTKYPYLPSSTNMNQILYDYDLERMSSSWLHQCLPGPAPCSALNLSYVTQLECTKHAEKCCSTSSILDDEQCTPRAECFVDPIIGCIHTWFWSAKQSRISENDIVCGHITALTYSTVQLLWAKTIKMGCATGKNNNGDVRVVCNFSPGAPFKLKTKYYCGVLNHKAIKVPQSQTSDIMSERFLVLLGINWMSTVIDFKHSKISFINQTEQLKLRNSWVNDTVRNWGVMSLRKHYKEGWARKRVQDQTNGTKGLIARLVTRYIFEEEGEARCDSGEPIYEIGEAGSECQETGRKFHALCYEFRDPTPGYRLVAVIAPVALFALILYDLFSGVMRQASN